MQGLKKKKREREREEKCYPMLRIEPYKTADCSCMQTIIAYSSMPYVGMAPK